MIWYLIPLIAEHAHSNHLKSENSRLRETHSWKVPMFDIQTKSQETVTFIFFPWRCTSDFETGFYSGPIDI